MASRSPWTVLDGKLPTKAVNGGSCGSSKWCEPPYPLKLIKIQVPLYKPCLTYVGHMMLVCFMFLCIHVHAKCLRAFSLTLLCHMMDGKSHGCSYCQKPRLPSLTRDKRRQIKGRPCGGKEAWSNITTPLVFN